MTITRASRLLSSAEGKGSTDLDVAVASVVVQTKVRVENSGKEYLYSLRSALGRIAFLSNSRGRIGSPPCL
jgi:hypothetical protein